MNSSWPIDDKKKADEMNHLVEYTLSIFERTVATLAADRGMSAKNFALSLIRKWQERLGVKTDD